MKTMAEDYYKALDVSRGASPDEIQKAYRKLAHKYHPDMNPDDVAAKKKFQEIQKAYDTLNDPEKRKLYDQFGSAYEQMGGAGAGGGGGGQPFDFEQIFGGGARGGPHGGGGFQFEGDLGDIFKQFTGGSGGGRGRGRRAAPVRGNDLETEATISFHTAVIGGFCEINLKRGNQAETLKIKIPPGVDNGKKIRLRGKGDPGTNGENGDLIVTIKVAPHPHFKRHGQNLELRLPVTIGEAALGATVDVPTPGGTVALKIPPGSSSGRKLRVKGQGVRTPDGQAGDLYVELQLKLPESLNPDALTPEMRQAIAQIDQLYMDSIRDGLNW
ncbi:MAG: J domain-containing protein [Pirellulaceae bacterium]|nr:J domain-containing protein [Pirellulaceae bacterium]